ncbi:MAG TPA: Abi family protein [Candidatus Ornithomonoglobus intestinigallinarum]|uniref:Abi family protein n=1 Tax=Candidatus Ornithomonoglobus intestinigallinarum TaxID=2840894 RepID=A0A9D1H4W6_9FIRM|nr:Abi family protein [Candidatus Ornithomonoglobus intestinigallinarum]
MEQLKKYRGQFPVWAAVELFTLGIIRNCYLNIRTDTQKKYCKVI